MVQPSAPDHDARPPPRLLATWVVLGLAAVAVFGLTSIRCANGPNTAPAYASRLLPPQPEPRLLAPEPLDDAYFPCSDCHEDEPTDRTVRALEDDHEDIDLAHGDLWCLHCHDAGDRDRLQLADQRRIGFDQTPRLCIQCHGAKLASWRAGVHGKREGHWWGAKRYWTCTTCHDAHVPAFAPIEAMPPPERPIGFLPVTSAKSMEEEHE